MSLSHTIDFLKKLVGLYVEPHIVGVPITAMKKHTYISGRSGSGKSELMKLLFYHLQKLSQKSSQYSLILMDPHGDLTEEALGFHLNSQSSK